MKKTIWKIIATMIVSMTALTVATASPDPFHTTTQTSPNPQTSVSDGVIARSASDEAIQFPQASLDCFANVSKDAGSVSHTAKCARYNLPKRPLTLIEVTDFALRNNPATRLAWSQARFAAAGVGVAKSAYLPQVSANASVEHDNDLFGSSSNTDNSNGANLSLSYVLLDFGNRANQLRASRYNLAAANFAHNSAIQQVVLQTQQAYYQVLGQQALVDADKKSVLEAQASFDAAQALRQHGMATIGDVYQAQSSLAQAKLNLEQASGNYKIALGQLATAMGLPANYSLRLVSLTAMPPIHAVNQNVTSFMAEARRQRPDLLSAEAQVRANQSQLAATQASTRPTLQLNLNSAPNFANSDDTLNDAAVSLNLTVPLFTGFEHTYQVRQAKAQLNSAQATRDQLAEQVQLQVWQAYYALQTAENSIANTDVLLQSSEQAVKQAMGQYKVGVGNILTVLTTQSSLANARVQSIQARLNWYTALAQLMQAVGVIGREPFEQSPPLKKGG